MELTPMMTINEYAKALGVDIVSSSSFALGEIYNIITDAWWADVMGADKTILNLEYFSRSGNKQIAPILELLKDDNEVSTKVAKVITSRYLKKWKGMYDTLAIDYNPLFNYYRTDVEHIDIVEDEKNKGENSSTSSDSNTKESIDTVAPYNTEQWKNDSKTNESDSSNSNESGTNNNQRNLDHDKDRKLTSEGRMGTMSVQAMIENEYKLRKKNLHEEILKDIDEVLTCPLY